MTTCTVLAQSFTVTTLSPPRNANAVAVAAPVTATFSQAVSAGSAAAMRVFSTQRGGRMTVTATATGSQLSFQPTQAFQAGEVLNVTLPVSLQSTGGQPLNRPQVYQFTTQTTGGTATFLPGPSVTPYGAATQVAGDLDGDGDVDLVTANFDYAPGTLSIRFNDGAGRFTGGSEITVADFPGTLVVADFDGDGDLDLTTGRGGSVLFNNGQGQFSGVVATGPTVTGLTCGDLDADGDLDLVTSQGYSTGGSFSIWLNNGSGSFTTTTTVTMPYGSGYTNLGDLDNDGDLDLLVGGHALYLNQGNATFASSGEVLPGTNSTLSILADFDGDLDLDVLLSASSSTLLMAFNNGQGSFAAGTQLTVAGTVLGGGLYGAGPTPIVGDFDGDGDADLLAPYRRVVGSATTYQSALWLNNGNASFVAQADLPVLQAQPVDIDGDLDLDLLAVTDKGILRAFLNLNAPAALAVTTRTPTRNQVATLRTSPVNVSFSEPLQNVPATTQGLRVFGGQRGRIQVGPSVSGNKLELVPTQPFLPGECLSVSVSAGIRGTTSLLGAAQVHQFTAAVGGGAGTFGPIVATLGTGALPTWILPADFDGNGLVDLLAYGSNNGVLTLHLNQGNGTFIPSGSPVGNTASADVVAADMDGDGDLDLVDAVVTNITSSPLISLVIYTNNGLGTFTASSRSIQIGNSSARLASGDIDGDGDQDIIAVVNNTVVKTCFNDGEGRLALATDFNLASAPPRILLADMDNDGRLDLVATTSSASAVNILRGLGNGSFQSATAVAVTGTNLAVADLDNDGDLDILTSTISVINTRFNNGSGLFSGGASYPTLGTTLNILEPCSITTGDIDGDGDLDLVSGAGDLSGKITVLLNNGFGAFGGTYQPVVTPSLMQPLGTALVDLDNDGDLDLAVTRYNYSGLSVCLNQPTTVTAVGSSSLLPRCTLYPNPAHGTVSIQGAPVAEPIQVLDALGRVVITATAGAATVTSLPISHLAPGIYTVRVASQALRLTLE